MRQDITFISNGNHIVGELHLPGETQPGERLPGTMPLRLDRTSSAQSLPGSGSFRSEATTRFWMFQGLVLLV